MDNLLKSAKNEALCAQVIIYKALGIHKQSAIQCMEEIAKRKSDGDSFEFEKFIDEELAKFPKFVEDEKNPGLFINMIKSFSNEVNKNATNK